MGSTKKDAKIFDPMAEKLEFFFSQIILFVFLYYIRTKGLIWFLFFKTVLDNIFLKHGEHHFDAF